MNVDSGLEVSGLTVSKTTELVDAVKVIEWDQLADRTPLQASSTVSMWSLSGGTSNTAFFPGDAATAVPCSPTAMSPGQT